MSASEGRPSTDVETAVDLVTTCFERTYREVLGGGHIERIESDNRRRFSLRTVLINNVDDRDAAWSLAQERIGEGEIDRAVFVDDHIDEALGKTGLTRSDLRPIPYFLDWALVAVCIQGPRFVLHWDADVRMRQPADWVGPAIELFERDRRVLAANPNWEIDNLDEFTLERQGAFSLGHGFSDQVFLARRSDLAQPIYRQRSIARWRYPFTFIFEARVDAWQRHHGRLRATYRDATYLHPVAMGTSWPERSVRERALAVARHSAVRCLRASPWLPRHLRGL